MSDILRPAIAQARFSGWVDCLGKEPDLPKGVMKSDMKRWRDYLKDDLAIHSASLQMSFFDLEGFKAASVGASSWWWLRSPLAIGSDGFHNVNSDGDWNAYDAYNDWGVSPGFCF
ncbi:MAG: hypothetical protein J6S63_11190 [Atopobiaceae bacterium]|nr:hypothetical protein [Atopobiaceae bacterium]